MSKKQVFTEAQRRKRNKRSKVWRKKNALKMRADGKATNLQRYYGLSQKEYDLLIQLQAGKCAICHKVETVRQGKVIKSLSVDHDHETGIIRGLLCSRCNMGLGHFNDSVFLLRNAIMYLDNGSIRVELMARVVG